MKEESDGEGEGEREWGGVGLVSSRQYICRCISTQCTRGTLISYSFRRYQITGGLPRFLPKLVVGGVDHVEISA